MVSLGTRKAWMRKTPEMVFHPYFDLLARRAPLLTQRWDAKIYAELGRNPAALSMLKRALRTRGSLGVKILGRRIFDGELWFQIQTPAPDACGEVPPRLAPVTGWIPAYDSDGEPYIWFSPAGC